MDKQYSISAAKNQLPRVIHEAEENGQIILTRRGKPVAVIMSTRERKRLSLQPQPRKGLWDAIQKWRAQHPEGISLTDVEIDSWRDRSLGRDFDPFE
jgi:prevent-host-death family protein